MNDMSVKKVMKIIIIGLLMLFMPVLVVYSPQAAPVENSSPPVSSPKIRTEEYTFSRGDYLIRVLRDTYQIPESLIYNEFIVLSRRLVVFVSPFHVAE